MIFGLANAPSEFQRMMYLVLGPLLNRAVLCYLDDILIPAENWTEMMNKLKQVLECLKSAKLTLKLSKCESGKKEIEYLGFVINREGIQPGRRKVKAIAEFQEPKNVHEVRRFLGLTSFIRRFVPKYAMRAEPLTRLARKDTEFEWKEQQTSFGKLKTNLIKQPPLALHRPDAKTEVHTDASSDGIVHMMLQLGEDEKFHLVHCVSKQTTDAEAKYHSSKLQLMAIVWTLDRFRQFLIGIKFTVVTDCQVLVYLNTTKTQKPQIARWCNLIQEYNFDIKFKPGTKMAHVDALSRSPIGKAEHTIDMIIEGNLEVYQTFTEGEQVLIMQHADEELRQLIVIFQKEPEARTKEEEQKIKHYEYKKKRLYRIVDNERRKLLYVVPKTMRKSLVVRFHDLMGHFSVDKTTSKIKELYWFPSMKRYVKRHISMCFECLVNKVPSGKQEGLLHPIKPGRRPFAIIHLDHLGPFTKSSKGNSHLLIIIDNFTRFVKLYPTRNTSAKYVVKALTDLVDQYGLPERIISDRGSCFTSHELEQYCKENGIEQTLNSTQHPQSNGMVERE